MYSGLIHVHSCWRVFMEILFCRTMLKILIILCNTWFKSYANIHNCNSDEKTHKQYNVVVFSIVVNENNIISILLCQYHLKYLCVEPIIIICCSLCDQVCQWLATGQWFSPGTPVSSTNKTDRHNITEILLKVALNSITL